MPILTMSFVLYFIMVVRVNEPGGSNYSGLVRGEQLCKPDESQFALDAHRPDPLSDKVMIMRGWILLCINTPVCKLDSEVRFVKIRM